MDKKHCNKCGKIIRNRRFLGNEYYAGVTVTYDTRIGVKAYLRGEFCRKCGEKLIKQWNLRGLP